MKRKFITWALALGLALACQLPGASLAQSSDPEALRDSYRNEIERAKEIIQRLKGGMPPTQEEFDILDDVLSKAGRAINLEPDVTKRPNPPLTPCLTSSEIASDKHCPRPPQQLAPNLWAYSLPEGRVYMYVVDLTKTYLRTFWLDPRHQPYGSIPRLQEEQHQVGLKLKFAINGGIFNDRLRPKGLYIEEGKILSPLDTAQPGGRYGNFYMEPNGVFMIDANKTAHILTTQDFSRQYQWNDFESIRLAVQSGPTLLLHKEINREFAEDSVNRTRRAGVGLIDEHKVVFGISESDITFRDFATLFARMGCSDALFFDGGPIPSMYVENQLSLDSRSELVTMLGVTEKE